jgi:hypothetical protein
LTSIVVVVVVVLVVVVGDRRSPAFDTCLAPTPPVAPLRNWRREIGVGCVVVNGVDALL